MPGSPALTETLLTLVHPALFSLSDKLFGKRLLQARHYIMSRKSWLKMVPTENCDILMTFPGGLQPHLAEGRPGPEDTRRASTAAVSVVQTEGGRS